MCETAQGSEHKPGGLHFWGWRGVEWLVEKFHLGVANSFSNHYTLDLEVWSLAITLWNHCVLCLSVFLHSKYSSCELIQNISKYSKGFTFCLFYTVVCLLAIIYWFINHNNKELHGILHDVIFTVRLNPIC